MPKYRELVIIPLVLLALSPPSVVAQTAKAGVVTALHGPVAVVRAPAAPSPLKFKDEVFLQEKISTGTGAIVRVLLGDSALLTMRERSVLAITGSPGHLRIELETGKIALVVAPARMRTEEVIDIRTPNADVSLRGTAVIAEVVRADGRPGERAPGVRTMVSVVRGAIEAVPLDPERRTPAGPSVAVGVNLSFDVTGREPPEVRPISAEAMMRVRAGLQPGQPQHTRAANQEELKAQALQTAVGLLTVLLGRTSGDQPDPGSRPRPEQTDAPNDAPDQQLNKRLRVLAQLEAGSIEVSLKAPTVTDAPITALLSASLTPTLPQVQIVQTVPTVPLTPIQNTPPPSDVPVPGLQLDSMLLGASSPIRELLSGSFLTMDVHAVALLQGADVRSGLELVRIVGGSWTISNGSLLRAAGGSLTVRDLAHLLNGATLNILGGALLSVSGGTVNITGALVRFTGTGNTINVQNTFAPTGSLNGVPVLISGGTVSVDPSAAFVGLNSNGTINVTPGGSLIVIQGGTVKVGP